MKKTIFMLAIASFASGMFVTSCKSNTDKENAAVENAEKADQNLKNVQQEVKTDAMTKATDAEWQTYKTEMETSIRTNEMRIAELKKALKKPGTTFDNNYKKSIDALEEKNNQLDTRIKNYENNKTDWDSFKREYDSDMKGLGESFRNITVNNKK